MPVSGGTSLEEFETSRTLNSNLLDDSTESIPIGSLNTAALYVTPKTGSSAVHVIVIDTSPDGTEWFPTNISVLGRGYILGTVVGKFIRARVQTVEGLLSTADIHLFST